MNARTFDLTPLNRAFIGFDRIFDLMDRQYSNSVNSTSYPPYNIVQVNENIYHIELAVAGFSMMELSITQKRNELLIEGTPNELENQVPGNDTTHYLHKGIANRAFIRTFTLADHVEVKSAKLELGILSVELERQVPEELQPKKIAITAIG